MAGSTRFVLNDRPVETTLPSGTPVLDFLRTHSHLKGTKEGCREGDCGACAVLVGSLEGGVVRYRTVTSCLLPLGDLRGRHLVSVEGLDRGEPNTIQQAIVDEGATQCGFCTPGIVMSLTAFCLTSDSFSITDAKAAAAGNICRCTGYASILRAMRRVSGRLKAHVRSDEDRVLGLVREGILPPYFGEVRTMLEALPQPDFGTIGVDPARPLVAGGTDLYVQRPDEMALSEPVLIATRAAKTLQRDGQTLVLGAGVTHEEMRRSPLIRELIPRMQHFSDLVSSEPIRNRATLAGNVVNASPIGDFAILLLALGAEVVMSRNGARRSLPLNKLFLGYKTLDRAPDELIEEFRIALPDEPQLVSFEKVSKRTHLDIASVNSAIALGVEDNRLVRVRMAAGGVAPIPLFLERTSEWLCGKEISAATAHAAADLADAEISPISDVRGSAGYKRLLLRQLIFAHFEELFGLGAELVAGVRR